MAYFNFKKVKNIGISVKKVKNIGFRKKESQISDHRIFILDAVQSYKNNTLRNYTKSNISDAKIFNR